MKPTRRVFLAASTATPLLISAIQPAAHALPQDTQSALNIVMDLIIPASDGMPSASEAGGLMYLENLMERNKEAATDIRNGLSVAEAFSQCSFKRPLTQLERNDQMAVLRGMEDAAPRVFDALRAYVYESYYTQPAIWKLIGYDLFPTDHTGPSLKP